MFRVSYIAYLFKQDISYAFLDRIITTKVLCDLKCMLRYGHSCYGCCGIDKCVTVLTFTMINYKNDNFLILIKQFKLKKVYYNYIYISMLHYL